MASSIYPQLRTNPYESAHEVVLENQLMSESNTNDTHKSHP